MSAVIQRRFSGGELAPVLRAGTDLSKYQLGAAEIRNFIVMRSGGVQNRQGTQFTGEVKDSSKVVRLIPMVLANGDSYVLEMGNLSIRVIQNGAYLKYSDIDVGTPTYPPKSITAVTKSNPCGVTAAAHGYSNGDEVVITGVVGMTEVNGRNFRVRNVVTDFFTLENLDGTTVNSLAYTAYTSGGTVDRIFSIVSTYLEADLPYLKFLPAPFGVELTHRSYAARGVTVSEAIVPNIYLAQDPTDIPSITAPTSLANNGAAGTGTSYYVKSVTASGEESLPSAISTTSATPSGGSPIALTWTDVDAAFEYKVYRRYPATQTGYYLLASVPFGFRYSDTGTAGTEADRATALIDLDSLSDGDPLNPGATGFFQQRLLYGGSTTNPQTVYGSRTGSFSNYFVSVDPTDASPLSFTLSGSRASEIEHFVSLSKLFILTRTAEFLCEGNQDGIISPVSLPNIRPASYYGVSHHCPIVLGDNFLFIQARGSIIRDFANEVQVDQYKGNDLTTFATHLFDGYTISDWAFQQTPNSVLWVVRSDGKLLSLTYIKEQQIFAWARHDFGNGEDLCENVCVVPEGAVDVVYFVIKRTIDGRTLRSIERIVPAVVDDVRDCTYLDSHLSFDGRNESGTTMTLSGGTTWEYDELLTLTASASFFVAGDIGNEIHLYDEDLVVIRFRITEYSSATVVRGLAHKTVPASLRGLADSWSEAVDVVSGLWHLEGRDVSVLADGFVVSDPNDSAYPTLTVADGQVTLPRPYAVIHAGLPIVADLETLDIDSPNGETMADKNKNISAVTVFLDKSRGGRVGNRPKDDDGVSLTGLTEFKLRNEENYDDPVALKSGKATINIQPQWNSNGRILIRQTNPLPITVAAVVPAGLVPFRGQ